MFYGHFLRLCQFFKQESFEQIYEILNLRCQIKETYNFKNKMKWSLLQTQLPKLKQNNFFVYFNKKIYKILLESKFEKYIQSYESRNFKF
jgi:hypothetical protein